MDFQDLIIWRNPNTGELNLLDQNCQIVAVFEYSEQYGAYVISEKK